MRDPARIKRIMNRLLKIWASESNKDLRFWQFICSLEGDAKLFFGGNASMDLFYLEDDEFEKYLYERFPNV